MTLRNILFIREFFQRNKKYVLDNRIIIFYDEEAESFYYCGTRNNKDGKSNYRSYSGSFAGDRIEEFKTFLIVLFDDLDSTLTTEIHHVSLKADEYKDVDFHYMLQKCVVANEIVAYDMKKETPEDILKYLMLLRTN